jgi:hypothetical protein
MVRSIGTGKRSLRRRSPHGRRMSESIEDIVDKAIENVENASEERVKRFFKQQRKRAERSEETPEIRIVGGARRILNNSKD